jgi:hypothetical protein
MDTKMTFVEHIDVIVGRAFATLGFVRRLASEFRDEYTLSMLYTSLVRPKLEHASCVWDPVYNIHREKIEGVQKKFIKYALRHLPWRDRNNLPPYEELCRLISLDTLNERRTIACIMFIFDILTGKIDSPSLLSLVRLNVSRYPIRGSELLRVDFHRTNYGMHEPINNAIRKVNENSDIFDFNVTRDH